MWGAKSHICVTCSRLQLRVWMLQMVGCRWKVIWYATKMLQHSSQKAAVGCGAVVVSLIQLCDACRCMLAVVVMTSATGYTHYVKRCRVLCNAQPAVCTVCIITKEPMLAVGEQFDAHVTYCCR